jgi:hypothetical protein
MPSADIMGVKVALKESVETDSSLDSVMDSDDAFGKFLSHIHKTRQVLSEELPIQNSLIALDILNSVAISYLSSQKLSVKVLMSALPHSPAGLRYHYVRLLEDGWLTTVKDAEDARIRWVKPTERLLASYQRILAASRDVN